MRGAAALIPVKDLSIGKSRLAPALPRETLADLSLAMLEDLVEALRGVRRVERIAVVTPDRRVADAAAAAGALPLHFADRGLDPSVERGARALGLAPDEPLLVVLGDVAAASAEDFDRMFVALDELGPRGVVLAEADDGGTAALLRRPFDVIPTHFGPDSARRHREAAEALDVPWRSLRLASLRLDIDSPGDVERLLAAFPRPGSEGPARRTRMVLARTRPARSAAP